MKFGIELTKVYYITANKNCYFDNYILTRITTVDMVLWDDISYGQYSTHKV